MKWVKELNSNFTDSILWKNQHASPGKLVGINIYPYTQVLESTEEGIDEISFEAISKISLHFNFLDAKYYPEIEKTPTAQEAFLKTDEGKKVKDAAKTFFATISQRFSKKPDCDFKPLGTSGSFKLDVSELALFDNMLNYINEKHEAIDASVLTEMKNHPRLVFGLPVLPFNPNVNSFFNPSRSERSGEPPQIGSLFERKM